MPGTEVLGESQSYPRNQPPTYTDLISLLRVESTCLLWPHRSSLHPSLCIVSRPLREWLPSHGKRRLPSTFPSCSSSKQTPDPSSRHIKTFNASLALSCSHLYVLKDFSGFFNLSPHQMRALKMGLFSFWFFPLCPQGAISTRNAMPGRKVFPYVARPLDSTNIY